MPLLLAAVGAVFALIFVLNLFLQTFRHRARVGFVFTLLGFCTTLLPLAALIMDGLDDQPAELARLVIAVTAVSLLLLGLVAALLELRRPEKLRGSRGVFALGVGALLLLAGFSVPFLSAYTLLRVEPAAAVAESGSPTPSGEQQARAVLRDVVEIIADESGLAADTVVARLDAGGTIAELVRAGGGDLNRVITQISAIMRAQVEALAREARIRPAQAALALSQMETIVRIGVNSRLSERGLGAFLAGDNAAEAQTEQPAVTPTPSLTPTATLTPTPSRTPAPPPTATATRQPFMTPTIPVTPSPTPGGPCGAVANYDLNLRAGPGTASAIVGSVPYNTPLWLTARSADSLWYLTSYQGRSGWVSGDLLTRDASCAALGVLP